MNIIQYTLEEVIDAIQNSDLKKLEKMVVDITYHFWINIDKYISSDVLYCGHGILIAFLSMTGIPYIIGCETTVEITHSSKINNSFEYQFYRFSDGYKYEMITKKYWTAEDFVNEQKWIDNINNAISRMKELLEFNADMSKIVSSQLPKTKFTIKDFKK